MRKNWFQLELNSEDDSMAKKRPRKIRITFNEEEIIINPEDVDPSIGRFRNLIETTVVPTKVMWKYFPAKDQIY